MCIVFRPCLYMDLFYIHLVFLVLEKGFLLVPLHLYIMAISMFHVGASNPMEPKIAMSFVAGGTIRSLLLRLSMHLASWGNADLMSGSEITAPASSDIGFGDP